MVVYTLRPDELNRYASTPPNSPFPRSLIATRADTGRRYTLVNTELNTHSVNGGREQRVLTSVNELRQALEDVFRVTLPEVPELDPVLRRVVEAG